MFMYDRIDFPERTNKVRCGWWIDSESLFVCVWPLHRNFKKKSLQHFLFEYLHDGFQQTRNNIEILTLNTEYRNETKPKFYYALSWHFCLEKIEFFCIRIIFEFIQFSSMFYAFHYHHQLKVMF